MKTIKIIELLNKIANGEEVPNKIKYRNIYFVYDTTNYCYIEEKYTIYNDLLMELSNHKLTELNYEVEIIGDYNHKVHLCSDTTIYRYIYYIR